MKKNILKITSLMMILALSFALVACGGGADTPTDPAANPSTDVQPQTPAPKTGTEIILATTTSTADSGLLDYLLPIFTDKTGIDVKVISVGTGQAIATAQSGDADVILVHARSQEDTFVESGYGVNRQDVMYNQFLILGPTADPSKVKDADTLKDVMAAIATGKAEFISRGDKSGTHTKELGLWKKAEITPDKEAWYVSSGAGMGDTLLMANEKSAYTITDEATYLSMKEKLPNLTIVREGNKELLNPYGVIAVNPEKFPDIKYDEAMKFIEFITGADGQKAIGEFGKDKYGKNLFTPSATQPADKPATTPAAK